MILNQNCYREILREELGERTKLNPHYSLRAFARDLGIAPASLSEILCGKHGLSNKKATQIAKAMKLSKDETEYFTLLADSKHARSDAKKNIAIKRLNELKRNTQYMDLQVDGIKAMTEWHHFAILELTYLADFDPKASWIANKLNISTQEVEIAVKRLLKLGMLEIKNNKWIDTNEFLATTDGVPSRSIQSLHTQIINKAKESITTQTLEERNISSTIMAIDKEEMPQAKELIKKFRREMTALMSKGENKSDVYCLSTQFFNMTD